MSWNIGGCRLFLVFAILAVLVAVLGIFLPDIRDQLVFKPRRDRAQAVVSALASQQTALRRKQGHYVTFTPPQAVARLRAMGIADIPTEDYLFDASLMADKSLRLRALPRPTSVRDLRISPRMYVAQLAPSGGVSRSGWVP
jgi:hypothetical protein